MKLRADFMKCFAALFTCAFCATAINAATIHVPADQPTIQAGIDSATNGDTVLVAPGTYTGDGNREISILGKAILVAGELGADSTVIDGEGAYNIFEMDYETQEDSNTVICGLTLTNAPTAIRLGYYWSSPKLCSLIFLQNDTGIVHRSSSPFIVANCEFVANGTGFFGCVTSCRSCTFLGNTTGFATEDYYNVLDSCLFEGNDAALSADNGSYTVSNSTIRDGVIGCGGWGFSGFEIYNCIIENMSGIALKAGDGDARIQNSVIRNNSGQIIMTCGEKSRALGDNTERGGDMNEQSGRATSLRLEDCQIYGNTGIGIESMGTLHMTNCSYTDNAGPVSLEGWSSYYLANCTFAGNHSTAICMLSGGHIHNTVIANNSGAGLYHYYGMGDSVISCDISCSNVFNNAGGNYVRIDDSTGYAGNISEDPLFCDPDNGNYYIYDISPSAPANNSCDTLMGVFGVGCYAPIVDSILVDTSTHNHHVVSHSPVIQWRYVDSSSYPQAEFEIAVGTDDDWEYAEMWNPPPFETSDTFVTYAGAALADGETYYLRLRVGNGEAWSEWYETSFRMNSAPSVPTLLHPSGGEYGGDLPILWILNSTDAEGDPLTYDFSGVHDTDCVAPIIDLMGVPATPDSTGGQVTEPLGESCIYWWRARAFDGYEHSEWSPSETFVVNATPEPPTAPEAQYPPDTGGTPVWDMLTYFYWAPSFDPDPLDTIRYKLEIAMDSAFTFVNGIDSIDSTPYTLADSLQFGTHYWWRVTAFDNTGMSTMSPNTPDFWTWTLGDLDYSHNCNIADLVCMVDFLFKGGSPLYPSFIGDVNGDCNVNVSDLTYLVDYLFKGGPPPKVGCATR